MIGVANQKVDEFIEKNTDIIDRDDVKGVLEKAKLNNIKNEEN